MAEADDFMYTGSYWRVSLVTYQKRTNVLYDGGENASAAQVAVSAAIEVETDALTSNVEDKFRVERENQFKDVRKPNEYNTIGSQANDYVRRALNKKMSITEENLYNNWTIISKYHYALGTLTDRSLAVKYRYDKGWTDVEDRSFTFWFRPKYLKPIQSNIVITSILNDGGYPVLLTPGLPESPESDKIKVGDWISVKGTSNYNGIQRVKEVFYVINASDRIILDTPYLDDVITPTAKFAKEISNTFIQYDNDAVLPTSYVELTYTTNWFIIKLNDIYYKFDLSVSLIKGEWYAATINLNNLSKQLSLFLYNTVEDATAINPDRTSDLKSIYIKTLTIPATSIPDNHAWKLLGCQTDLTNIRIWSQPIEEELQELILSQYVVKDSHLALLIDNASPELLLPTATNPR